MARQKPRVEAQYYQLARKVIEPLGECKSDYDFISELTKRMGYEEAFPWKGVDEAIDHQLKPIGLNYKMLENHPEHVIVQKYPAEKLYRK